MPSLPHLITIKRRYERIEASVTERTRRFAARLGHQKAKSLANTLVIALLFLVLPSHQAYALPLLVPLLWAGGAALGAWIGSRAIEAIGDALMSALVGIAWLLFTIAGYFMMAMAGILDLSIQFTINSEIYRSVSAIQVGWTAVRDLANMFFIFVLLFIAIQTILGMGGSNAKRWVAHLVIAALLINFSLFFTQVVVDAGNVLASGFWNRMRVQAGPNASSSAAAFFIEGFRMQTNFDTLRDPRTNDRIEIGKVQKIEIYLGGMFVQFVAGYVFLAGAILMIVRSVTLMVLMIASPFAFLGFALPKGGGFASRWLDKLIGATFLAPAFVFMLYIDSLIIRGTEVLRVTGADQDKFALAFIGTVSSFAVIYNFLLMIILLLASLKVASEVGSGVGASAGKLALGAIGGGFAATAATGGLLYRNSVARYAASKLEDKKLHERAALKGIEGDRARREIERYTKLAKGTGDVRATSLGKGLTSVLAKTGVDTGGPKAKTFAERTKVGGEKGSFVEGRDKREKEVEDEAKKLFPDNPQAQKAYIEKKLGSAWTDTIRNKKSRETLDAEAKKRDAADVLEKQPHEYDDLKQKVDDLEAERKTLQEKKDAGTASATELAKLTKTEIDLAKANADLKKSIDEFTDNLKRVGTKHFTEMELDETTPEGRKNREFIKSELFNRHAAPEYAKSLESRDDLSREDLKEFRDAGLARGSERMKDFYKKQMRNEDSRHYEDHKAALTGMVDGYDYDEHDRKIASYDAVMGGGGTLSASEQAEYDELKKKDKDVKIRMGYMVGEDVAKVDADNLRKPGVARGLTPSALQAIARAEKDDSKFGKDFIIGLREQIKNDPYSDPKAKSYIERIERGNNKESPFSDKYWT